MGGKIMVLKLNEFRDKLAGCWAGKNVGGVKGIKGAGRKAGADALCRLQ